jgi:hypothetical protein
MKAEAQSRMYRALQRYIKPQLQSLTYVEVPVIPYENLNNATQWTKIFDKEELERVLHERNRKHFSQAATDNTPFTVDPLYSLFEFTTDTDFGKQFREGNIDLRTMSLDEDVLAVLEELLPKEQDDPTKISDDLNLKQEVKVQDSANGVNRPQLVEDTSVIANAG